MAGRCKGERPEVLVGSIELAGFQGGFMEGATSREGVPVHGPEFG